MSFAWISDDGVNVIAIVGICKNAGKTTLLNHIIHTHPQISFGVFSTGIDGEERDSVYNTPKPSVLIPAGTVFCCDQLTLDGHSGELEVLAALREPQRPLWLARSLYNISSRITGPATVSAQIALCRKMLEFGAEKVLVDGSLDRKSISLSPDVDALALVAGASFGKTAALESELRRLLSLSTIPLYQAPPSELELLYGSGNILLRDNHHWIDSQVNALATHEAELLEAAKALPVLRGMYFPGALTSRSWSALKVALPKDRISLICRHPDCIKLEEREFEELAGMTKVHSLIPFRIKCIAINSESADGRSEDASAFRAGLRASFPNIELIDVMELVNA